MFDRQREQLLASLDVAHAAYYKAEVFGGPSLHFHLRAICAAKEGDRLAFAEQVYAVLSAWGMHRMGPGGSKMCEFNVFEDSLNSLWPSILILQRKQPADLDNEDWKCIREIFCGIRCMASKTSLVGNSKVMAHALPNLIPPVDRQYTLRFLRGRADIVNHMDTEWTTLELMLRNFFYPILRADLFRSRKQEWMQKADAFRWNTSPLKIVDNLIIGFMKVQGAENEITR